MDIWIAQQLKEAGWPQGRQMGNKKSDGKKKLHPDFPYPRKFEGTEEFPQKEKEYLSHLIYIPTLEELIEACMADIIARNTWQNVGSLHFFELAPNINTSGIINEIGKISEWRATWQNGSDLDNINWSKNFFGSTPKDAVAKLWLELNKK